jgi:hypothetical protein
VIPTSTERTEADEAAPLPRDIGRALRVIPWATAVLMLVLGAGVLALSLWNRTHLATHEGEGAQSRSL